MRKRKRAGRERFRLHLSIRPPTRRSKDTAVKASPCLSGSRLARRFSAKIQDSAAPLSLSVGMRERRAAPSFLSQNTAQLPIKPLRPAPADFCNVDRGRAGTTLHRDHCLCFFDEERREEHDRCDRGLAFIRQERGHVVISGLVRLP